MEKHKIEEARMEHVEKKEIDTETSSNDEKEKSLSYSHGPVIKSEAEKKFVKKLNWTLFPLIWAIVFIQFADKTVLTKAAVMGMLTDTNTTQGQFSILGSIFYVGLIAFQVPNSYLIQRYPIRKYLGILIVLWGISILGTAFCKTYGQLLACRVLLGMFEAPTFPCLYMIISTLYRRQEQSACIGFLWICNGLGIVFSVSVTVGIIKTLDGASGISLWRWNYIIFGIMTIVIGTLTFFFLVDHPHSKLLRLTEEEKQIVEERTQDNAVVKNKVVKIHHYWEALREPRYYLIVLACFFFTLSSGGLIVFAAPFIKSLGFDLIESIVLTIPISFTGILFIFFSVFLHQKTKKFSIVAIICGVIAMVACILLAVLPHSGIKLLGYYLTCANNGFFIVIIGNVSINVSGYSKKVFYNGSMVIGNALGSFVGPLLMLEKEAPSYRTGMIIFAASNLLTSLCLLLCLYLMHRVNKKRLAAGVTKTDAYLDLTDREDPNFIYKL